MLAAFLRGVLVLLLASGSASSLTDYSPAPPHAPIHFWPMNWTEGGLQLVGHDRRLQAGCTCSTVAVVLSGDACSSHGKHAGEYVRMNGVTQGGRAVYQELQDDGGSMSMSMSMYLFYDSTAWLVGPNHSVGRGFLFSSDATPCPEDAGAWRYLSDGTWESGGVQVTCDDSGLSDCASPPPPSPAPPSPEWQAQELSDENIGSIIALALVFGAAVGILQVIQKFCKMAETSLQFRDLLPNITWPMLNRENIIERWVARAKAGMAVVMFVCAMANACLLFSPRSVFYTCSTSDACCLDCSDCNVFFRVPPDSSLLFLIPDPAAFDAALNEAVQMFDASNISAEILGLSNASYLDWYHAREQYVSNSSGRCAHDDLLVSASELETSAPGLKLFPLSMVAASILLLLAKFYGLREKEKPMGLCRCYQDSESKCRWAVFESDTFIISYGLNTVVLQQRVIWHSAQSTQYAGGHYTLELSSMAFFLTGFVLFVSAFVAVGFLIVVYKYLSGKSDEEGTRLARLKGKVINAFVVAFVFAALVGTLDTLQGARARFEELKLELPDGDVSAFFGALGYAVGGIFAVSFAGQPGSFFASNMAAFSVFSILHTILGGLPMLAKRLPADTQEKLGVSAMPSTTVSAAPAPTPRTTHSRQSSLVSGKI